MKIGKTSSNNFQALPILKGVVENDLCVGCGLCLAQPGVTNDASMMWNSKGFLVPDLAALESLPVNSLKVCPFNPFPDEDVFTEDQLAKHYVTNVSQFYPKIGKFENIYAGYSKQYRLSSSSGGLATYFINELFDKGLADYAILVSSIEGSNDHYNYTILKKGENVLSTSKTRYYPVSMANILKSIDTLDGKLVLVGIPCFIKSIRLHQHYNPSFSNKLMFTIGIVCGGMKSKYYADYLAEEAGSSANNYRDPNFRVKDLKKYALDYSYSCVDNVKGELRLSMRNVGDMWGTGLFKNNACDFCDDVAAELADVTLGDAWISPYVQEGGGTNVIITRSKLADNIIVEGLNIGKLVIDKLGVEEFIQSQQGGYNHRHAGMKERKKILISRRNIDLPPKRFDKENISLEFKLVQRQRMIVREKSISLWTESKNLNTYKQKLLPVLTKLQRYTIWYRRIKKFRKYFSRK